MNTRGAGRIIADPEAEHGNAHVVFSAAKRQGGAVIVVTLLSSLVVMG